MGVLCLIWGVGDFCFAWFDERMDWNGVYYLLCGLGECYVCTLWYEKT